VLVAGCGDDTDDDQGESIRVSVSDELVVSWDGGGVGEITVNECSAAVESCPTVLGCSGTFKWSVEVNRPLDNPILSPQEYGAPVLMTPGASKDDLEPGRTYSLTVIRYRECDPPDDGCLDFSESGCTVFVP